MNHVVFIVCFAKPFENLHLRSRDSGGTPVQLQPIKCAAKPARIKFVGLNDSHT